MDSPTSLTDEQITLLKKHLLAAADKDRIMCSRALAIAKSLGIPTVEVGRVADILNVKISKCQLGCF